MATSHTHPPLQTPQSIQGFPAAECSALLDRVGQSTEIRRAARLRDFLHFVGAQTLTHPTEPVSEHEIGVRVFGRSADYDTSVDNIVRVNASELRKRVAAYFAGEGRDEPIWFEIPRGTYTPRFFPRPEAELPPAEVAPHAESVPVPVAAAHWSDLRPRTKLLFVVGILLLIIGPLATYFAMLQHRAEPWRLSPALSAFWSQLLDGPRNTQIVLADTSFVVVQDMLGHRVPLAQYLDHSYVAELDHLNLTPAVRDELNRIMARSDGSLGDFGVARHILALAPDSARLQLGYARSLSPTSLTNENLVLVGSSYSNPWSSLYEPRLNFQVESDAGHMFVLNRAPLAGEQPQYASSGETKDSMGFCVIALLPTKDGNGHVLLIEGTTAEATAAAGDFLTSESGLHELQTRLGVDRPASFEALLRTTRLNGTPLSAELLAVRRH